MHSKIYDDDYREKAFWIWYNNGKLNARKLKLELVSQGFDPIPSEKHIYDWFREWKERAEDLDQEIKDKFSAEVIEKKVDMLRRHADLGRELQKIGMDWLKDHKGDLTANAVARLIKDGYEMEKVSVGVPEALTKMLSTSDEELIKQIEAAITDDDLDLLNAD